MEENLIVRTACLAMEITKKYIHFGDTVIDATCGNGNDTLTLAQTVGESGRVIAFDVQKQAIDGTSGLLACRQIGPVRIIHKSEEADVPGNLPGPGVTLVHGSFTGMRDFVPEEAAAAVVFNLGYLPGGDKATVTRACDTVPALDTALALIRKGGIISVVMYDGHDEGAIEKAAVLEWAAALDKRQYHAAYVNMLNQPNHPPEILWVTKK